MKKETEEKVKKIASFLSKKEATAEQVAKQFKLGDGNKGTTRAKRLISLINPVTSRVVLEKTKPSGMAGRPPLRYSVAAAV